MSTRSVLDVQRITYSFTREELVDVLIKKGADCRGQYLLPNPTAVEWTKEGVSLVYEYRTKVKGAPPAKEDSDVIHRAREWPELVACGKWGKGEGRAYATDRITCPDCKRGE